jgi:N,N-dimethylformamidase
VHVNEDMLGTVRTVNGEPVSTLIRADMVYFKTPSGGAVFSVGSMTFLGSLWRNGFEGPISRLLQNVVARFSAPARSGDKPELGVGSRSQNPNEG